MSPAHRAGGASTFTAFTSGALLGRFNQRNPQDFAQNMRDVLVGVEDQLNTLLGMVLDNQILQEEYANKKRKLINYKMELRENLATFERKSDNRFRTFDPIHKRDQPSRKISFREEISGNVRIS